MRTRAVFVPILNNSHVAKHAAVSCSVARATRCARPNHSMRSQQSSARFAAIHAALVAVALLTASGTARACDFCNCLLGINPFYTSADRLTLSMLLQRTSHPAGMIDTGSMGSKLVAVPPGGLAGVGPHLMHGGAHDETVAVTERRTTFELAAQHHFSDHFMITATLPLLMIAIDGEPAGNYRGMGDPALTAHYVATVDAGNGAHAVVMAGVGLDLPLGATGLHNADGERLDPTMQPGSGSADAVANVRGMLQTGAWTIALDALARLNTENADGYRFGHTLTATATVNRDLVRSNADQFALVGIAGLRAELAGDDRRNGLARDGTGFTTGYAQLGMEVAYGDVRLTVTTLLPAYSRRALDVGTEDPRFAASVGVEF